jgi:conjugal transfer ATP-binding protein TraC
VISDIFHPTASLYPSQRHWNRYESLSLQLIDPESILDVHTDHLAIKKNADQWEIRSLAVADTPKSMTQWNMTHAIGHLFNPALQMPCPYLMSLSIKLIDGDKSKAQWNKAEVGKKANSKMTEWLSTISSEYADWSYVRQRLNQGDKLASACFHIMLSSPYGKGLEHEAKVRDLFRANGWQVANALCMQLPHFKASIPMMMAEGLNEDFKSLGFMRTMLASNAVSIAPLQGEWRGTQSATLLLPGRRGQLAMWSPFDNQEGNFNVSVAASSGKGKSMVIQDYIIGLLGSGGRVWVIDVGRSYERTCRFVGGTFIEFSRETSICINPFSFIKDFDWVRPKFHV